MTAPATFRSRIVGHSEEDPTDLLANPRNWRVHPGRQRDALRGSLESVGWVQSVIVNDRTGHVVDGHARIEEAISRGEATVPVVHVDLSEEEENLVLATLDPIGAMATTDRAKLEELLGEAAPSNRALADLLERLRPGGGDAYTGEIRVPRYEPTGAKPAVAELVDLSKVAALTEAIEAADLDDELRAFLVVAANRHARFDYGAIAEFYAHAEPAVQRLMEASALVIVDFDDAIRDGYVRFVRAIEELEEGDRDA